MVYKILFSITLTTDVPTPQMALKQAAEELAGKLGKRFLVGQDIVDTFNFDVSDDSGKVVDRG